jgi:hypothetical protein
MTMGYGGGFGNNCRCRSATSGSATRTWRRCWSATAIRSRRHRARAGGLDRLLDSEAGLGILENAGLREVRVSHPDTGEMVLVTREEILEHAGADRRALEAAERYSA